MLVYAIVALLLLGKMSSTIEDEFKKMRTAENSNPTTTTQLPAAAPDGVEQRQNPFDQKPKMAMKMKRLEKPIELLAPLPSDYFDPKTYTSRDFLRFIDGFGQQFSRDVVEAQSVLEKNAASVQEIQARIARLENAIEETKKEPCCREHLLVTTTQHETSIALLSFLVLLVVLCLAVLMAKFSLLLLPENWYKRKIGGGGHDKMSLRDTEMYAV